MNVAVFCGCGDEVSPFLLHEVEELGAALAEDGHAVIYGGAQGGCMGALARGVRARQGHLVGVIPEMGFMDGKIHPDLVEQLLVPDMSGRKAKMNALADAFLVLPGGIGTLDEAFEVLALKSCGSLLKPVIFYNYMGMWSPLLEAMELLAQQRLVRHPLEQLVQVLDKISDVRETLNNNAGIDAKS